jgi:hypothetical protein
VRRLQSKKQFNNSLNNRAAKDAIIRRVQVLIQSNRIAPRTIRGFDPSLRSYEISWLFSEEIDRFGSIRLERIENSIRAFLEIGVAA